MNAEKLQKRWRDLSALAEDPGATAPEARAARAAGDRIAAQLRAHGWEPEAPAQVPEPPVPPPPPEAPQVPTISVHGRRRRRYDVAAPFWCPTCGNGRNHGGRCPVCRSPTEATPAGALEAHLNAGLL